MKSSTLLFTSLGLVAAALPVTGCSRKSTSPISNAAPASRPPTITSARGPIVSAGAIPPGQAEIVTLSNGAEIILQNYGGTLFFQAEALIAEDSFARLSSSVAQKPAAERRAVLSKEVEKIFSKLRTVRALPIAKIEDVGYFSFWLPYEENLLASLRKLSFDQAVLVNPIVYDREAMKSVKAMNPAAEGLVPRADGRTSTTAFSGLERIGASEFARRAESDIGGGARVDGSSVKLGITDTGLTLNHPTFLSADGTRNRVEYLRDFTREGRVFFNPAAKFEARTLEGGSEADLVVTAEILVTPRLPASPAADALIEVKDLMIKVSPELRALLLTPGSGAKLGVLTEDSFQAPDEAVDINNNGKTDDKLYVILIPGASADKDVVYFDASGTADFRASKPMASFNVKRDTMKVFAETVAFDLREDKLPKSDGSDTMPVRSASIVGYDPGNHGSHVAGIAAGSKTIANDDDLTLARGVAPGARILLNRVCANNGGCGATAALADLATNGGAEVINMSLGGLSPFNDGYGVQEALINRLTSTRNTLFVISAGNSGPGRQTVGSPSTARLALSVGASASRALIQRQYQWPGAGGSPGAVDDNDSDFMLFFSSRGPTAAGGFKPNVSAPGTELSSIQLNTAPGARGGLDVYWGTSMAAPTATGAYALFLDGVKKFNAAHPEQALATDAVTLRQVLIESARPFDVASFDPATGARTQGQYTWADQGKGMIHLPAAWKKLQELRDNALPAAVTRNGQAVELDYQVLTSGKGPNGIAYDGTRAGAEGMPAFGTGVYLDFYGTETLKPVYVARRLPEKLADADDAGDITRQLLTTKDEFVLKTVFYGSDRAWIKAGVRDELNCAASETANLTLLGRGVEIEPGDNGTGTLVPLNASVLNLCVDRAVLSTELSEGDHGAIISAYRTVGGKVASVPSFMVPVFVTVPHKILAGSTAYEVNKTVTSFGVSRNYVTVPEGTTIVKVTLEVPAIKTRPNGIVEPGQECSGVELMMLEGQNISKPFKSRKEARISNCDANGAPVGEAKRKLTFLRTNPTPGSWDVHVFGSYKFARSAYRLRVDYLTSASSVSKIEGGVSALTGSMSWTIKETSMSVVPDSDKSSIELDGLFSSVDSSVANGAHVYVSGALGALRAYPAGARSVTITTGGSAGNDIDLAVIECPAAAKTPDDVSCAPVGTSGGSSDEEIVRIIPRTGKVYAVRVDGYDVKNEGAFVSTETIGFAPERGSIAVAGTTPEFSVSYGFSADQLAKSRLATSELFTSGKFDLTGSVTLRSATDLVLSAVPIRVSH